MVTYLGIFPASGSSDSSFWEPGTSVMEDEHYDRIAFAYYLVFTCGIVWTVLVVLYATPVVFHSLLFSDDPHASLVAALSHDFGYDI
jgi:hypothetical protein